jgi:hypothetical protein
LLRIPEIVSSAFVALFADLATLWKCKLIGAGCAVASEVLRAFVNVRVLAVPAEIQDDALTLISLGVVAFIFADVTHEALGHGLATLLVGAKPVLLTTCYFSTQGSVSRWIPAGGGLANACVGLLALLSLLAFSTGAPRVRYFMVLVAAFNLFFASAYPAYSGIALFGDWAAVISGLEPVWSWRIVLILAAGAGYWLALIIVARAVDPFFGSSEPKSSRRLQRITLIPFLAALASAFLGGIPNPAGWKVLFTAAVPAAAASFGLTQLDHFSAATTPHPVGEPSVYVLRSVGWIVTALAILILFVAFLGPGIRFR